MPTSTAGEVSSFFPTGAENLPAPASSNGTAVAEVVGNDNAVNETLTNKIRIALPAAILEILAQRPAVFLERFGILYNEISPKTRWQLTETSIQKWQISEKTIRFEKCNELTSLQRQEFTDLAELRELCAATRRVADDDLACSERDLRHQVKAIIQAVRDQVVTNGYSDLLPTLGQFFALHNRQGTSLSEWYAGADIFLDAPRELLADRSLIEESPRITFPSAWDLAQQRYGRPVKIFSVNLKYELEQLGYQIEAFPVQSEPTIRVAVFKSLHGASDRPIFHYLSDGMRTLALGETPVGSECLFQLIGGSDPNDENSLDVPSGTSRVFTLAWILMQGSKNRVLSNVAGMSSDSELFSFRPSKMNSILVSPSEEFPFTYQARDRAFTISNMVSLYEDEAELLTRGKDLLIQLLHRRQLDKISNPARPSLLARSNYAMLEQPLTSQVEAA